MNCVTHCALCGRDLALATRSAYSQWEIYEVLSHESLNSRFYVEKPDPIHLDEDRELVVCDCTAESVAGARGK